MIELENKVRGVLSAYNIQVNNIDVVNGATVSLCKVYPEPGTNAADIRNVSEDIAHALGISGVRVVTMADCIGIEVPNAEPAPVLMEDLLKSVEFKNSKAIIPLPIGQAIDGQVRVIDLVDAPNILVGGAPGQGSSMFLEGIDKALAIKKSKGIVQVVQITPEKEQNPKGSTRDAMNSLCDELDRRYRILADEGISNIKAYNNNKAEKIPYVAVIIEEYSRLADDRGIMKYILYLARKGKKVGIHIIISTTIPTVDIISISIKAAFPTRIAFRTRFRTDSWSIIDLPGAEKLIGNGDMLFAYKADVVRLQGGQDYSCIKM